MYRTDKTVEEIVSAFQNGKKVILKGQQSNVDAGFASQTFLINNTSGIMQQGYPQTYLLMVYALFQYGPLSTITLDSKEYFYLGGR